jgi:predicted PurR-regulated permease PerM
MAPDLNSSRWFLLLSLALVLSLCLLVLSPFLTPVLLAIVVATLLYPLYEGFERRLGGRRSLSSVCMCVFVTFLIIIPTFLLAVTLTAEMQRAFAQFQQLVEQGGFHIRGSERLLAAWRRVGGILGLTESEMAGGLQTLLRESALFLVRNSSAILTGFVSVVADFFIMLFTLFFLFRDGKALLGWCVSLVPLGAAHKRRMMLRFKDTVMALFLGSFSTSAAQGVATWGILWTLGFQNALFWGTLAAFTSLVPLFGAGLVWIPASLYLLLQGNWPQAVILAVFGSLVISTLDNIVRPLVMRKTSSDLHTLLIFFGILGGISMFGFSGLILGPVIMAFTVTILDIARLEFQPGVGPQ